MALFLLSWEILSNPWGRILFLSFVILATVSAFSAYNLKTERDEARRLEAARKTYIMLQGRAMLCGANPFSNSCVGTRAEK